MLTIKVETPYGADLCDAMVEMLDLARRTGCRIEMRGNDTVFWVYPDDSKNDVVTAFHRLYPHSKYVASNIPRPAQRDPKIAPVRPLEER